MIFYRGEIYFDREHVEPVVNLPGYDKNLYFAIAEP